MSSLSLILVLCFPSLSALTLGLIPVDESGQDRDIRANVITDSKQEETNIGINPHDPCNWVGVAKDWHTGVRIGTWFTTLDAGQTWTSGEFPLEGDANFSGDPVLSFAPNGDAHAIVLMYGSSKTGVYHYRSEDGGQTWSSGKKIHRAPNTDKVQIDIAPDEGPYPGAIAVTWIHYLNATDSELLASVSHDRGNNWSSPVRVNQKKTPGGFSPDVAWGPDGRLYVLWTDRGSEEIFVNLSLDGGQTFGNDRKVADYRTVPSPIPGSGFRMFPIYEIACDVSHGPFRGSLYVAYHTWTGKHSDIYCAYSRDGGNTFQSVLVHPDDDRKRRIDQVQPAVVADENGNVLVAYYDRRLDPENFLLWCFMSRSSDGGASWRSIQVSDVGYAHKGDIGDYLGLDAVSTMALPFWTDRRSRDLDVYVDPMALGIDADKRILSANRGGQVKFELEIGPNAAGLDYWLLATLSGTTPGVDFPNGVHLPLNPDALFGWVIATTNSNAFRNFRGTLGSTGDATAVFDTLGPFDPGLVGMEIHFSALWNWRTPADATGTVAIEIVQ